MTDVEKQATNIIREWTSLPREHAALLALKLNKAGLLTAPVDGRDTRAQFDAWRRNAAERTKAGSVGVATDEELRALLGKCNAGHYMEGVTDGQ